MEDDEISSADEDIAANIPQGCTISDNDLLDDLSPTDIKALIQRLLPGICQQSKLHVLVQDVMYSGILTLCLQMSKTF